MDHRSIVAWEFRIGGLLLGVPALFFLIDFGWDFWSLGGLPATPPSQHLAVHTYGLIALLSYGATGLGTMLKFLGTAAIFAGVVLAIGAGFALLLAVLLYAAGSGISRHKRWARVVGVMVSIVFLFAWIGMLFVLQHGFLAIAAAGIILSLYTLWVLSWKYA